MAVKKAPQKERETNEQILRRMNRSIAMSLDLDGVDLRVFLYLSASVGFEEFAHVPQIELATELGRRKEHISRSIRKLTEAGILIPAPEGSRSSKWRFNPDYGN